MVSHDMSQAPSQDDHGGILAQVPLSIPAEHARELATIGNAGAAGVFPVAHSNRRSELSWAVLAAFQVLLYRYSRQDDITIGTPKTAGADEVCALLYMSAMGPELSLLKSPLLWCSPFSRQGLACDGARLG